MNSHEAGVSAPGQKYESPFSTCLEGKINGGSNDDLCAERDRLIGIVSDINLDTKEYRKAVEALRHANDVIERLIARS